MSPVSTALEHPTRASVLMAPKLSGSAVSARLVQFKLWASSSPIAYRPSGIIVSARFVQSWNVPWLIW